MDCNKEEAVRAKGLAEKKMQNKDFVGARKIAIKAQQLYPDLENISQMLTVCDVHCSAEHKLIGNEIDWYGVLQIEQTADEASIKKQYRKLALLLHPDKNKFSGAEAAFKLIGEAQRVLLDREKRSLHDMRRKACMKPKAAHQTQPRANKNVNFGRQSGVQNSSMNNAATTYAGVNAQHQRPQQQASSGSSNGRLTFWTVCPFCAVRYQYYREIVNRSLRCQSCGKTFIAYDMNTQSTAQGTSWSQPAFPQQKPVPNQDAHKVGPQSTFQKPASNVGFQGKFGGEKSRMESFSKTGCTSEIGGGSKTNEKYVNVDMKVDKGGGSNEAKSPGKVNGKKRKKQEVESSESCDTGSSSDTEELVMEEDDDLPAKQNSGRYAEQYPRRSNRHKQHVSYSENVSDDDNLMSPRKRAKGNGSSSANEEKSEDVSLKENICKINKQAGAAADVEEDKKDSGQKGTGSFDESLPNGTKETKKDNGKETVTDDACKRSPEADNDFPSSSTPKAAKDPEFYEYPDPDFNDFDKYRKEECFTVGQTWAVYDTVDAMPRFYAQIRKVFSTGFKLRITWLEPDPSDEAEIEWVSEDLPYSCGNFKRGKSENTGDRLMFSHLVSWEKDRSRDAYKIHPRKGETWALFKNWDIKWSSDPESHRKYEFEYVEVLSEYDENVGISVVYLSKLKGFACLFCRILKQGIDSILIPPSELLRFSHRIPSFKLTGEERQDVPRGSLELDPASLPANIEEIPVPEEDLKMEASNANSNGSVSKSTEKNVKPMTGSEGGSSMFQVDNETHLDPENGNPDDILKDHSSDPASVVASTPEAYEIPEPDFCNFDAEKSPEKFQVGQIWALYSDEDGLPKYYCQIKKIDSDPDFKLHVTWLEACSPPNDMIQWLDKKMLTTCGRFKIKKGKPQTYTSAASFSHQLRAELTDKKNEYAIFPRKGEVWALYKNWNAEMTCSDLENCEYDIVEVLDENDLWIEVLLLERVEGYNAVFKSQVEGRLPFRMKIPRVELLRFSHQIPAFHLTEERDGALKGNLELDPASLPILLFCSN